MSARRVGVWPPLPPGAHVRRPVHRPFPLDRPGTALFSRARHGLWNAVRAVGLVDGDEVLVPAYHHGSEVEALRRAGLCCVFYRLDDRLAPIAGELDELVTERTRALYLIHFLGLPQDAAAWREWADARELLLVEDAAQAFLASLPDGPVGSFGGLSLFCVYKTFGLADGAAVTAPAAPEALTPNRDGRLTGGLGVAKRHAVWLGQYSSAAARALERLERTGEYSAARDFALGDPGEPPAGTTRWLLPRVSDPAAASARRRNYAFLLERLGDRVPPPFAQLPAGASPFAFPVAAGDKGAFLAELRRQGVHALNLWSEPHPLVPREDFPAEQALRDSVIGLPVHQELREEHLEWIVRAATRSG